jgi:hypothetical protein
MRRLLPLTLLALTLFGGTALADRDRYDRRDDRRERRDDRRDRRQDRRDDRHDRRHDHRGPAVRDHRTYRPVHRHDRRVVTRNRVYVNNGRYHFHGGVSRTYVRPVIRHRYYDVRVRPQLIVETYEPVPGYMWVQGNWTWNGYEWTWTSGYFAPDTRYRVWYDDGSWE